MAIWETARPLTLFFTSFSVRPPPPPPPPPLRRHPRLAGGPQGGRERKEGEKVREREREKDEGESSLWREGLQAFTGPICERRRRTDELENLEN